MKTRMLSALLMSCLLSLAPIAHAARGAKPLVEPAPIAVPSGVTSDQVSKAIQLALIGRGWTVAKSEPGLIQGHLSLRQHRLLIGIRYDSSQITMRYIDSSELGYEVRADGTPVIHPKYTTWLQNLSVDINKNLLSPGPHAP